MNQAPVAGGGTAVAAVLLVLLCAGCEADRRASPVIPAAPTTTTTTPAPTAATTTTSIVAPTTTGVAPPPGKNPVCLKRAHFGDPADSGYILPYPAGEAYYMMQSYCVSGRPGAHSDQLAYDWFMPVGAEVVAARSGWVREMRESNPDNGRGYAMENYVYIEHADGTIAFYAHLMQHGVDVEVGQWVDQGERIGASGNSGNTQNTPHLHFGVYRAMPQYEEMGVPVNFRNADGPLDTLGGLLVNRLYRALPWEE
ncbi:MAG: M23 family metallopeptidase [Actinomycetota bacterium]